MGNYQNVPKVCTKKDANITMFLRVNLNSIKLIFEVVLMKFRVMNQFYCALSVTEFNRISSYSTVKEIWDKLVVIYKGTNQEKESIINIFIHQYKKFKIKPNKSINKMFTHFTLIINSLNSLRKTFSIAEKVFLDPSKT